MQVLVGRSIAWLLFMIIQDKHGFISFGQRVRPNKPSSTLPKKLNVNMGKLNWQ
jgi:hypothetical protein